MIEVFADIWCPFAYVGLQVVHMERDAFAPDETVRTRAWPLELVNGAPMNVDKTAHHIHDLREQLGLPLFAGFNPSTFPTTTLGALALVAAAQRAGVGDAVNDRLRVALWEEGRDVGAAEELAVLAAEFDLVVTEADHQSVVDDWHEGERRNVKGSPHFFCGDRDEFCPSLSLQRDDAGVLDIAPNPGRVSKFLQSCWS